MRTFAPADAPDPKVIMAELAVLSPDAREVAQDAIAAFLASRFPDLAIFVLGRLSRPGVDADLPTLRSAISKIT